MAACVLGTLPLEWVYDARVWRRPIRLAKALAVPFVVLWFIDSVAIVRGLWWFSRRYVSGWTLPHRVPVEELVFFLVVPICAILTFEAASNVYGGKVTPLSRRFRRNMSAGSRRRARGPRRG